MAEVLIVPCVLNEPVDGVDDDLETLAVSKTLKKRSDLLGRLVQRGILRQHEPRS